MSQKSSHSPGRSPERTTERMIERTTIGVGIDTVHLPGFRDQLRDTASSFVARTFTAAERAASSGQASGDPARHLGARFAAKEAFIKAWSTALWGSPPVLSPASVDMREIEVVADAWRRPALRFHGAVARALTESLGRGISALVSLSHDGPAAVAVVMLQKERSQ